MLRRYCRSTIHVLIVISDLLLPPSIWARFSRLLVPAGFNMFIECRLRKRLADLRKHDHRIVLEYLRLIQKLPESERFQEYLEQATDKLGEWGSRECSLYFQLSKELTSYYRKIDVPFPKTFQRKILVGRVVLAESCRHLLAEGELDQAERAFSAALGNCNSRQEKDLWIRVFHEIAKLYINSSVPVSSRPEKLCGNQRKIIVGGTGWSGSGAVVDYLSEFSGIQGMPSELRFVEGIDGLGGLWDDSEDRSLKPAAIIDFFLLHLLGLKEISSYEEQMARQHSWILRESGQNGSVALAAMEFIPYLVKAAKNREPLQYSLQAINSFIDRIIKVDADSKILLLNNVLHARNVRYLSMFQNTVFISVFRDPRSQFVANMKENRRFHRSVEKFIEQYREDRMRFTTDFEKLRPERQANVLSIGFEEFVRDRTVRNRLSCELSLAGTPVQKYKRFKPWQSARNVIIYKQYEDQKSIELIEERLREFCVV